MTAQVNKAGLAMVENCIYVRGMTFQYVKVLPPELVVSGWLYLKTSMFCFMEPILQILTGEIVYEHPFLGKPFIKESDEGYLSHSGLRKIPSDIAVRCKEFLSGWDR